MTKEKKAMLLSMLGIITLLIVIGGATYAYFQAQNGAGANVDTTISTNTTDSLVFEVGDPISITANTKNFAKDGEDLTSKTTAKAILKEKKYKKH